MKQALCLKGYDTLDRCAVTRTTLSSIGVSTSDTQFIDAFVKQYPVVKRVRVETVYVRDDWDEERGD